MEKTNKKHKGFCLIRKEVVTEDHTDLPDYQKPMILSVVIYFLGIKVYQYSACELADTAPPNAEGS